MLSALKATYLSSPSRKQDSWEDRAKETSHGLRRRGRSRAGPLVPHPAAEPVCSLEQLHEWRGLTDVQLGIIMKTMISKLRRFPYCTWKLCELEVRMRTREGRCVCWNNHIFSIVQFFIFIPIYCSHVYYVHVGFEYSFIPFIQEKNCTKQILLKFSFIFKFLCLIFFFFFCSNCM